MLDNPYTTWCPNPTSVQDAGADTVDLFDLYESRMSEELQEMLLTRVHFWICVTSDTVAVGFGNQPGKQLRLSYKAVAFVTNLNFRVCSVESPNVSVSETVTVSTELWQFADKELQSVIAWRDETVKVIESIEYHMHKGTAQLRALRGDFYVMYPWLGLDLDRLPVRGVTIATVCQPNDARASRH